MSANANTTGSGAVVVDVQREFLIFDTLPQSIRDVLNNAEHNWSVETVARMWIEQHKRGMSPQYFAYELKKHLKRISPPPTVPAE